MTRTRDRDDLLAANGTLTSDLFACRSEITTLTNLLHASEDEKRISSELLESVTSQLNTMTEQYRTTQQEITTLKQTLQQQQEQNSIREQQIRAEYISEAQATMNNRIMNHSATSTDSSRERRLEVQIRMKEDEIAEIKGLLTQKQAKYDQLQEKLNTLSRTHASTLSDLITARDNLSATQKRLDAISRHNTQLQTTLEVERTQTIQLQTTTTQEIQRLRNRHLAFDDINNGKVTKDVAAKLSFYEDQLREADQTLIEAKQAWLATGTVLQQQVQMLEKALAEAKVRVAELSENADLSRATNTKLEAKLNKADHYRQKLSEVMNRFEIELVQKKSELAAVVDQLNTQEYEQHKLQTQLHLALEVAQTHLLENARLASELAHRDRMERERERTMERGLEKNNNGIHSPQTPGA